MVNTLTRRRMLQAGATTGALAVLPTTVLLPGHIFRSSTVYRFKTDRG